MDTEAWYKNKFASVKDDFDFKFDSLILDITETIRKALKDKGITLTNLAERLNVTPPAISKLLRGESNFTIKKLMEISEVIGLNLEVNLVPKPKHIELPDERSLSYLSPTGLFINSFYLEKTDEVFISALEKQDEKKVKKTTYTISDSSTSFSFAEITDAA